eukprot:938536-Prymnesium_polylepis.1
MDDSDPLRHHASVPQAEVAEEVRTYGDDVEDASDTQLEFGAMSPRKKSKSRNGTTKRGSKRSPKLGRTSIPSTAQIGLTGSGRS